MDYVRKAEAKERNLPKATRWTVLKAIDGSRLTEKQQQALAELEVAVSPPLPPGGSRRCCAGSERPLLYGPRSGASPTSPAMP
ncbi:hypothetical protein DFAR_2980017 [Desulfarculales bacterium]